MKKIRVNNRKSEKGAITLFVLLACLFFVFILTGAYISNLNRLQVQEQEVKQIQENYAKDLDRVDEIYENLSKSMSVTLAQYPDNGIWVQEVTLKGKAQIKEGNTATIVGYAFTKNTTAEPSSWTKVNNQKEITETSKVTENGTYYFWAKDSEGEIKQSNRVEVKNIDKIAPIAGTLIAKELDDDGNETGNYDLSKSPWTNKDVYIEKVDGSDQEPGAGHKETTYTILKDGLEYKDSVTNPLTDPTTLTETGTYTITVTTTDKAGENGNKATNTYTIRIDKVVPTLALKHNDSSGADYDGTWTKDDLYGEIDIDTSTTGKTVQKYQYSENGIVWRDVEQVVTSVNYTINNFGTIENKPEWIGDFTNNGTYYFELQEDGTLKPNNNGVNSSTANSYVEIDLTGYTEANLDVTLNVTISSESDRDIGYATITKDAEVPTYDETTGRFIYVSGVLTSVDYTTTLTGGQKYYLHIGYRKDDSTSSNQDTFIINSINFKSDALTKAINFSGYTKSDNKVTFKLIEDLEKEIYIRAIYLGENNISKYGNKKTIKIDKKAPVIENINQTIISKEKAKVDIKVKEEGSGIEGYYINTEETDPTKSSTWTEQLSNEFTIEGLSTNTTYYLWIIDKVGNISEKQDIVIGTANYIVDEKINTQTIEEAITIATDGSTIKLLNDYIDTSIATFDKSVTFDVQSYTLTRSSTITIENGKTVEIKGTGKITTETTNVNTITNNGIVTLSDSVTIENSSTVSNDATIYNSTSTSIININDNVQIFGYYRGVYNYEGTLNVNGGKIEATYSSSSSYGIYNYSSSSKIYINNGEIKGYCGIYNYDNSAILEIMEGKVVGTGACGIYNASATINIYGGRIEGKTYGIYSNITEKVIIGRAEDVLSTTQPAIYGESYGIYMNDETYSFDFYNGVIISNTKETAYRGVLNPRTGYMPYTYWDDITENKYCTILVPTVANIKMEAQPTEYTNRNVTVTITYPYNNNTKQYSEDGMTWKDTELYIQEIIATDNKTIYARTLNESGVITDENQIEITNIDKENPTVTVSPTKTNYIVTETNATVDIPITITATDTGVSGLDIMQYAWVAEGEEPTYIDFINTVTINKTKLGIGQYNLYLNVTDKAGNKADLVQMKYTVKYEEPVCQIETTQYTTVQAAVEACAKNAIRTEIINLDYTTTFPMGSDKPNWIGNLTNNGTYYFEVQADGTLKPNNSGINSSVANSYIEIDLTDYPDVNFDITLNATISSESVDRGYATITNSTTAPKYNSSTGRFIYVSGTTKTENHKTTLTGGQKYYLHIGYRKDSSTHSNQDTFIINNFKITADIPTQVIDVPTTIEMLKNTDEEFTTYEGQNIILDLKGYTIGSSNLENPLCTNNAVLQLIDSSAEKTGKLESLNGTAILNSGTFILGDNSTSIEMDVPTVYGYKVGINNQGIFNFYDGKIQGITPIIGNITDTPEEYGPVSTGYENGITTIQLGIEKGYVARIEWVYYTSLEDAVKAAKVNDAVIMLKDIQLKETLKIAGSKNISLDLNEFALTVATDIDIVIDNYGKLEITDSSANKTGNISITASNTCYAINNIEGDIVVAEGTISSSGYGIYNVGTGKVEIIGGTVSGSRYGIYNDSVEDIEVTGGTVSSNSYGIYNANIGNIKVTGETTNITSSNGYAIYNNSTGNIEIAEGTVMMSGSYSYGIYNNSIGNIKITGGTIECKSWDTYVIYNASNGIVEIIGGIVKNGYYGVYNANEGIIKVTGGMISCDYSEWTGIYNGGIGNVIVTGGIISNSGQESYGIRNDGEGTVTITGGVITTGSIYDDFITSGIFNGGTGTIIIGSKENSFVSQEQPNITGGFGLYNEIGNVEFYNGIIQGFESVTNGSITKVREGYKIEKNTTEDKESIYLVEKPNEEYIVQIEDTKYYSVQEAIDSIGKEEKTIKVLRNFELEEKINFNKNIILDLNGCTITNNYYRIENTGNLTINDLTENKEGKIECTGTLIGILNSEKGNIIMRGGTVNSGSQYGYGIYNTSSGNLIIEGGTINNSNYYSYGIYNYNIGSIEIIGGTISGNQFGIYNESDGIVTVEGGTISSKKYGIYNYNTGDIMITGGTVSSSGRYGIYNYSAGKIKISGGMVSSITSRENSYGIYNYSAGIIEITGGIVSSSCSSDSSSYGIYNGGVGNIIVIGGSVSSSSRSGNNTIYSYGIYNYSTGKIEITGGTLRSGSSDSVKSCYSYGVYNYGNGNIEVTGGIINNSNSGSGDSYSYGIWNKTRGNIIIGTKGDGLVSQEEPHIKWEYTGTSESYAGYGIYNISGKLYFYDGKIEGITKAVYDTITEIEDNSNLNYTNNETILILTTTPTPVAQIGETKYTSLQTAINDSGTNKTIIEILRNVTYTNQDTVATIPNTKNIVLDLKGYKIISSIPEMLIQNEGILEITDTSEGKTGTLISNEEKTINNLNNATLIISEGTIYSRKQHAIYNEGTTLIKGGKISSSLYNASAGSIEVAGGTTNSIRNGNIGNVKVTGGTVNSIYNASTGNIKVMGGTVDGGTYGIYNANTGIIEVTGGTVSSSGTWNSHGIYNASTGSIIIGTRGDGMISQESPSIIATKASSSSDHVAYGIYNSKGTLKYYDGVVKGSTRGIYGNITEIEDKTKLLVTSENIDNLEYEVLKLQQKDTNMASVNGTEYDSIQKAVEACGTVESTITMLRDSDLGVTIIIEEGQNITIDLNGYIINNYTELQNKGTLKIIDSSEDKTGKIIGLTGIAVINSGNMELIEGSITDSGYGIKNTGKLNITGGNITNNTYGVYNYTNGVVTLTNGTITSNIYGLYNYSSSSITNINAGTIISNEYGIYNYNGTTNIIGTGISNNEYGIYITDGTANIKEEAEISSHIGAYAAGGILNIGESGVMNSSSPLIIGETYGLSVLSTETVYMYDGQIKGKIGATYGYITNTESGYTVNTTTEGEYFVDKLALTGTISTVAQVNGIEYSNLQSAINSVVGEENQTIKLTNGILSDIAFTIAEGQNIILDMNGKTISSDLEVTINNSGNLTIIDSSGNNVAKISSTVGTAIVNSGTLTLGQDDGTVNQELITIEGTTYGIENTGTLNFYDGTINGASAISGTITNRPDGYVIRTTTVNSKERYYLSAS